jgi:HEAT repeat protein
MTSALRRRAVAVAGHQGDEALARGALGDEAAEVRAAALSALARMRRLRPADLAFGLCDPEATVRRRACEVSGCYQVSAVLDGLVGSLGDGHEGVVEAACWALGEVCGDRLEAVPDGAVEALCQVARAHESPLCREAAVAALGAIGSEAALATVLGALSDKPAVRRRAVIALAAFEGPEVEAGLTRALSDPDWQVRQGAEDVLGASR